MDPQKYSIDSWGPYGPRMRHQNIKRIYCIKYAQTLEMFEITHIIIYCNFIRPPYVLLLDGGLED